MNSAFRIYSDILQLRTEGFLALKHARGGMRYALRLFFIVTLLAGAGIWIGLPAVMQRPLIVERIDQVSALVDRFDREVVPEVNEALEMVSQEKLNASIDTLLEGGVEITSDAISDVVNQAGITAGELADVLSTEAAQLGEEARAELEAQAAALRQTAEARGIVTSEQIDQVLEQTALTGEQLAGLVSQASLAELELDRLRAQVTQQAPRLEDLLAQIPLSAGQLQTLVARLALSPERLADVTLRLGLTPEQIGSLQTEIDAVPEEANGLLANLRDGVEQFHPPLGVRFSRFIHLFGEWISTPFAILAQWAFFGLLLLVVAKLLGGTGTVRQHILALLLAAAPLFMLFFTYVPDVTPAMSVVFNPAFTYFGRILALVAAAWAALILLKSLSVTHEFGMWRSLLAVALTWATIYVIFPVVSFLTVAYILGG